MLDPQLLQKLRGANSLSYVLTRSSPFVNLKLSSATTTPARLEPVHRWQRVQWQYPSASGSLTSYSTLPHKHVPLSVSAIATPSVDVERSLATLPQESGRVR